MFMGFPLYEQDELPLNMEIHMLKPERTVLRYQKHRRGCPCLQCDDLREARRQKFMEIGSRMLPCLQCDDLREARRRREVHGDRQPDPGLDRGGPAAGRDRHSDVVSHR